MNIYLDNAATTPLDPLVLEAMQPFLTHYFGNPSSIHADGRTVRAAIETARKTIAEILSVTPAEIVFTSGGTEADNTFITGAVDAHERASIITSKIEHPAVLQTIASLEKSKNIQVSYVELNSQGHVDLNHLEELLSKQPKALITLMHANNEIGNITDLAKVSDISQDFGAIFHSDTVQTIGHLNLNLSTLKLNGLSASAHKLHGPKGVGFMYVRKGTKIPQYIKGGSQERSHRGGTENVYGIIGMAKALEIATANLQNDIEHISALKKQMIEKLTDAIPGLTCNGNSANFDKSLYTILSLSTPPSANNEMILFNLDLKGISASGGSACASGSTVGSHVLSELNTDSARQTIRFSFSRLNTRAEINEAADKLIEIYNAD